ncbi:hypothetical protein BGZ89_006603, partial [Linnemannia elongata]
MQSLAERVTLDYPSKYKLDSTIHTSKTDDRAGVAVANSITILIRAKLRFNGSNFRGIRISLPIFAEESLILIKVGLSK